MPKNFQRLPKKPTGLMYVLRLLVSVDDQCSFVDFVVNCIFVFRYLSCRSWANKGKYIIWHTAEGKSPCPRQW